MRARLRTASPAIGALGALILVTAGSLNASAALGMTPLVQIPPALQTFYDQPVNWASCGSDSCAEIRVPLDYLEPEGDVITLSIRRVGSSDLPALFVNPGGPGSGGTGLAQYVHGAISSDLRKSFSIVGFDPRGTGESAPITCMTGKQANTWLRTDATPDTAQEVRTLMRRAAQISQGCLNFSSTLASHIGTDETVKDMDIMRGALKQEKLNWLGFSYGTSLGSRYSELFPESVGRMVLDGAVDPALDAMQLSQGQSTGFQLAIKRFNKKYPGTASYINKLFGQLDHTPMRTEGPQKLVQSEAQTAVFYSMYSPYLWSDLNQALNKAKRGDGTALQKISYEANDQTAPAKFATNSLSAFYAINCWDLPSTPKASHLARAAKKWSTKVLVPELAESMSWGNAPCSQWFGHSGTVPAPVQTTTSAPILIIGTTFDPATPLAWAKSLHNQMPTSSLVTFVGDGHTAYLNGNSCVDSRVDNYLLTGVASTDLTCRP